MGPGRWGWLGVAVGIAFGITDYWMLTSIGGGLDVASPTFGGILLVFLVTVFALLGYTVGRLAEERATVKDQLVALENTQRALVQQEKLAAIGRLAAGIAHEVRNPLGVIRSSAAMIEDELPSGSDPARACRFIREETERLNALITSLLDFARPVSAKLGPVKSRDLVESALRLAADEIAERDIRLLRRLPDETLELRADPDLTTQALLGLVLNAAEAVGNRGSIEVTAARSTDSRVHIDVADDGPGVSEEIREQVFEPFYTSKPKGTGLGLPMVRRSVEAQGGRVFLVPGAGLGADGAGARFRIELPS